jgi:hypothetical protein
MRHKMVENYKMFLMCETLGGQRVRRHQFETLLVQNVTSSTYSRGVSLTLKSITSSTSNKSTLLDLI